MKKLGISIAAGVLDIISLIIYSFAIFLASAYMYLVNKYENVTGEGTLVILVLTFTTICIVMNIVGVIKSKESGMKHLTGNILGLIGHTMYVLSIIFTIVNAKDEVFGLVCLAVAFYTIFLITLSAIFTLRDNKV